MGDLSSYAFSPMRQSDLALYRGQRDGLQPILIVEPTGESAPLPSLKRLEHEYSLRAELDPRWAARPVSLTHRNDRVVLILEDPGGQLLERLLGQPLDTAQFLRIAIPLTTALRQVHEGGLIHKDIKPGNVLVDLESSRVWLTGFGIASRLPREHQPPEPAEDIAGTLAYMAPEQTGRMNRPIDSRSDLYALGVTFYEMLVGVLPFAASEPLEWVHCHVARQPIPPKGHVSAVPEQISAIVMKLLSKTAEQRYQTAAGVESDLRRCLSELKELGRIDEFSPGAHDLSDRLLIPEKLYGRASEVAVLLASFDRIVRKGTPEFVLVSGYSGIGKSSIVNELDRVLVPPRALFASGKLDQHRRDIPYVAFAQAFQSLVRLLLGKSEAELEMWRDALCRALDPNGQLIVNLVPELKLIIGEQPAVPDLSPQDAQRRFPLVLRRFLGVFAQPEHPLALFLDDLQWSDAATLDLIENLLTQPDVQNLMLIGAYRDNEVDSTHPLIRKLEAIRKAGATVHQIMVAPLGCDALEQLIVDTLHCEMEQVAPLAQLVEEKTAGNPFFAIQFLTSLAEERLLTLDRDAATWTWDLARIRARGFTDNIADLMVSKLKRLPEAARDAMAQLACLGNRAAAETFSMVQGMSDAEITAALWDPLCMGLIFRSEAGFSFLHDRIQEAAYALIPPSDRAATHLRIGRLLAEKTPLSKIDSSIFDIVSQVNRGAALITSTEERQRVAEFNLIAGKRAKTATAFASALTYFTTGEAMLGEDRWDRRYPLAFELALHRGETEFLTGNSECAEARLAALARRAANLVDLAAVTQLRLTLYLALDRFDTAIEVGLQYLGQIGIAWPAHPSDDQVAEEFDHLWGRLGQRSVEDLVNLPVMDDQTSRATIDVFTALAPAATYTDTKLVSLIIGRMVRLSLEKGICDATCYAYVAIGRVLGPLFGDYRSGYRFAQIGLDLVDASGHFEVREYIRGRIYFTFGALAIPWAKHICTAFPFLRRAFEVGNKIGDLTFAAYSCNNLYTLLLAAGVPLAEIQREARHGLEFARRARIGASVSVMSTQLAFIRMLQGKTAYLGSLNDSEFDEGQSQEHFDRGHNVSIVACWYWIYKLQAFFFADRYLDAIEAASKAERLLWANATFFPIVDFHFYGALSRAAHHDAATPEEQKLDRDALVTHKRQMDAWAEACRENFSDRAALVAAELARIEGHDLEAMRNYEDAIKLAREHGFIQNEGIACEIAAKFYANRGFATIAHTYLRKARYCYVRWGAEGKIKHLEQRHPPLREELATAPSSGTIPVAQLDVAALVEASHALSGEIILDRLVETLMKVVLEYAGAERGLLVLLFRDKARVEAEAENSEATVKVTLRQADVAAAELPESILHTVIRTRQSVILDDAQRPNRFSSDTYLQQRQPRSVLCLALVKQARLIGALYLENNLAPDVFTPQRLAVLELLTSQAAISLETARLYANLTAENIIRQKTEEQLRRSEAFLIQAQELSQTGSWRWNVATDELDWSKEYFRIFGFSEQDTMPSHSLFKGRIHPVDRPMFEQIVDRATRHKLDFSHDYRIVLPDGSIRFLHSVAQPFVNPTRGLEFVGTVMDITERKIIEENLRTLQSELARAARLTTMGELLASIAHEVSQPLTAVMANSEAGVTMLDEGAPDLCELRKALLEIATAGTHAAEVIQSIRAMAKKSEPQFSKLDIEAIVEEVLALVHNELERGGVVVRMDFDPENRKIYGDKVQLQQVLLNLIMNGVEVMNSVLDRPRVLAISGRLTGPNSLLVKVEDTGTGIEPEMADRMFDAFYTTKLHGMGIGLSICRSIIKAHGGRIWASPRTPHGAMLCFTIATAPVGGSSCDCISVE